MNNVINAPREDLVQIAEEYARQCLVLKILMASPNKTDETVMTSPDWPERFTKLIGEEATAEAIKEGEAMVRLLFDDEVIRLAKDGSDEERSAYRERFCKESRPSNKLDDPIPGLMMHHVTDGKRTRGWIHTHGMDRRGLPELEMRDVPAFLAPAAAGILREVCHYMIDTGVRIKAGETMATSPRTALRFVKPTPIFGAEDHYRVERLLIKEIRPACEGCGKGSSTRCRCRGRRR